MSLSSGRCATPTLRPPLFVSLRLLPILHPIPFLNEPLPWFPALMYWLPLFFTCPLKPFYDKIIFIQNKIGSLNEMVAATVF